MKNFGPGSKISSGDRSNEILLNYAATIRDTMTIVRTFSFVSKGARKNNYDANEPDMTPESRIKFMIRTFTEILLDNSIAHSDLVLAIFDYRLP